MDRPRRVGLPWYAPEQYQALRTSLADGAKLPPDYETWRIATEQMEREVQRSGVEVVRVPIEPEIFAAWCERAGLPRDAAARARYAAAALAADWAV
ncbi:hypothetical protein ABID82_000683 [Methylobacterium sp. PvP062]|jgi:hypothetical protein|uniref:Uncharacterized protein n=2 Tax=Methylobacterium radiotolerans TaxID=31998 RepID=B1M0A7_METRJ|nr:MULTISPECIES: hypothetical protein [Methylobacterium]MCX7333991.1 hypothetical protein [Hyphomicrobiales bacterium]GAN51665.1 hypothetical protein ME121_5752 [Methylobacterium sp. ME121]ACB26018.1 conserved hypothetical protein [Methylobacterium radiotolerans JCM 2831]KIU30450.1 hypothetical protein SR39_21050 [Methylobacterium radiotolerans]KTS07920.1 hypothetical protein SB3_16460 [Methylobacterium radiotolerans]